MMSSLAAVLLVFSLLGALVFWTRRAAAGGALGGLSLKVVEAVNLGSGRSITVVRSGERYFLLGATAHSISLIAELEPGDAAALRHGAGQPAGLSGLPLATAFLKSIVNLR